jgi:hypothetical protein
LIREPPNTSQRKGGFFFLQKIGCFGILIFYNSESYFLQKISLLELLFFVKNFVFVEAPPKLCRTNPLLPPVILASISTTNQYSNSTSCTSRSKPLKTSPKVTRLLHLIEVLAVSTQNDGKYSTPLDVEK